MAIVSLGSLVIGMTNGMDNGILPSGTWNQVKPQITYTSFNPDGYLTSVTGSDIVYCIGDGKVYMGDVTNGPGGSTWAQIK